jgi:hypothetical protein
VRIGGTIIRVYLFREVRLIGKYRGQIAAQSSRDRSEVSRTLSIGTLQRGEGGVGRGAYRKEINYQRDRKRDGCKERKSDGMREVI